ELTANKLLHYHIENFALDSLISYVEKLNIPCQDNAKKVLIVKNTTPTGQISPLVNKLLKEYLKQQKREQLISDYKSTGKSKAMREEDKIYEGSIEDGIEE
ncbi:11211_t:CDS:2, partial [Dentiscutata erythropus]